MKKITNRTKGPISIMVKSKKSPRSFTTLPIPGLGSGKNFIYLEEERFTEYINRMELRKLITVS